MFLPKPNIVAYPDCAAPQGIGLGACNSGNSCNSQSCDVNKPAEDKSCGWGLGVGLIGAGATLAAGAAGA